MLTHSGKAGLHTVLRFSLRAAALLAAASGQLSGQQVSRTDPVLQAGDAIRIHVWRMPPDLSGEFDIDAAGRLVHPLYDSVTVAGVPLSVAQGRIAAILRQQQANVRFSVQPLLRVAVEGEVRQPGISRHPPETTIGQAIALAGGPTERGRIDRVDLVRRDQVRRLDLRDPTNAAVRTPIQSGDRIIVGRRGRTFREYVVPIATVVGTAASVANLVRRSRL